MATKKISERRTVMISSTARDLPEHREQVRLACERAGFAPHDMMEHLPALNADAIKASLDMVERADVYVGIFAHRYGYVPDGHDISITEMEYNRASELGKPRLIFFSHEDHLFKTKDVEKGPGAEKLEKLKDRIGKKHVAAFFKSAEDLRGHVVEALTALAKEIDSEDAADAVANTVAKLHRISAIPAPPEPYVAHPYTLLQSRELVGRQAELNALTDWVTKSATTKDARIFCLVAIGGMGKSALTWKWCNDIAPNEMRLAGRMWWSFYESDATFENFLIRALCYVNGESEEEVRKRPWQDREDLLLKKLSENPYLLVLDGLERILIAYNTMDASRLGDDDLDRQTANRVAGAIGLPITAAQSFVGQHRLRQTTDPRAGAFLQKLAQITKSRTLISTRLYPGELQLPNGQARPGCAAYFLPGLTDDDAITLWRALGVTGSRGELLPIFNSVQNHPLLVQALASEVANNKRAPGDFAKWRVAHPQFDPASLPMVQSRSHILQFALNGLSGDARNVLSMIVGFRMPASYASLEALLVGDGKKFKSMRELDRSLTELEDRGLIGWDRGGNRYDAHPIVRSVVWQLTAKTDQQAVYKALDAHFEPMAMPDFEQVESLADLAPAIERYHTLVGLIRYDDAIDLFYERLSAATLWRLAAYRERILLLEQLFPAGIEALPCLTREPDQAYASNALAQSYLFTGQPGRAALLFRQTNNINERRQSEDNLSIGLSNLSESLRVIGALREAEWAIRKALALDRKRKDKAHEAIRIQEVGPTLAPTNNPLARLALRRSRYSWAKRGDRQGEGLTCVYCSKYFLWLEDAAKAADCADSAWGLAGYQKFERDFIRAALLQGSAALALGKYDHADERLHHALIRARAVNLVEAELPALIALAQLALKRDDATQAHSLLNDVWEAAERGPYPLEQTDAYNVLADIALAEGEKPAAINAAIKAYKAAWCDGPPYAYHWGLEKAKAHLKALGAPEPELPPFDESKFPPLPEVDINPKDEYWVDPDKLDE